jgi:hypothetical protein
LIAAESAREADQATGRASGLKSSGSLNVPSVAPKHSTAVDHRDFSPTEMATDVQDVINGEHNCFILIVGDTLFARGLG